VRRSLTTHQCGCVTIVGDTVPPRDPDDDDDDAAEDEDKDEEDDDEPAVIREPDE
jgi:hypothetical protein